MTVNKKSGYRILVTGADGMLARAVAEHCRAMGDEVLAFTRADMDISDRDVVSRTAAKNMPDIVFNCAAFTNVDLAEHDAEACFAANATGPESLAVACREIGAAFVTISTDYVFDGKKKGHYIETDKPAPLSIYGRSKLEGEQRVAETNPDAVIIRSGWIFGSDGRNFLSMIPDLVLNRRSFTAVSDVYGTPTYASDLACRMRELVQKNVSGIFHVANSDGISTFYEFAIEVCRIFGVEREIVTPISAHALNRKASRPKSSPLASIRLEEAGLGELPAWKRSLELFLRNTY